MRGDIYCKIPQNYEYNELNIRKKITNARGQIRQVFHDAMGRITGYTSPEGAVSYTYDANGNVLTVTDSHGTITRTYDALNRVASYTDTYGKMIRYEYDAVGNLSKLIYPDNTAVTYAYDANHNLIRVTDWANRVTAYTYDANNRIVGVTKPDGSVTTTIYDNMQRVTSTVVRAMSGTVIAGFEYTYDNLSRIVEEKHLADGVKLCYIYDNLSRVIKRTVKCLESNTVLSEETFTYDAAGNITDAPDSCFQYDTNNRLVVFNGHAVSYDLDGNMLNNGEQSFTYDSANRLITADGHTYTYNAEDVRIRNLCTEEDTTYTYNTNAKLSMLLMKTTNGVVTKYVYGKGLIGEEVGNTFKIYHFDCRGSTIAITDASGNITDTFTYDTYGKTIEHCGNSAIIFGYNGRDGVVTDDNGLIYMRARYYSPEMKRFINADVVAGAISSAITLNRFAYANGNPVSFVDPFGLSAERGWLKNAWNNITNGFQHGVDCILQYTTDFFNSIADYVDYLASLEQEAIDSAIAIGKRASVADNSISISMISEEEEIDRIVKYLGLQRTCDLISQAACDKFLEENDREFLLTDACVSKEILDHIVAYNWSVGKTSHKNHLVIGYLLKQKYNNLIGKGSNSEYADSVYNATESIDMREADVKKTSKASLLDYYSSQAYVFNYKEGLREEYQGTEYDPWADER